jgi:DNA sulfur modification protein DndC
VTIESQCEEGILRVDAVVSEIQARTRTVNIVSFSGGKDSSVVLQLVLAALAGTGKKLYIVTADTLMEIPYFQAYVDRVRASLQSFIDRGGINAEIITVRPDIRYSFWVSVLGKGYPAAHMGFRWCTGHLKIDPIVKFTKTVTAGKDFTVFVGVRSAESELRAKIYKQKDYKPNHYAPILDWSSHDVWEFLLTEPCPWGDHSELVQVYRYSSDECVYGEKQGVCVGNARYGCWACPLQKHNQLDMIGANTNDAKRYRHLKRFKGMLVGAANKTGYRSRIRRNGSDGCGPFLVEIRKRLYGELKKLESGTGWKLITPEEESLIFEHWETDSGVHNVPDQTQACMWGSGHPMANQL